MRLRRECVRCTLRPASTAILWLDGRGGFGRLAVFKGLIEGMEKAEGKKREGWFVRLLAGLRRRVEVFRE